MNGTHESILISRTDLRGGNPRLVIRNSGQRIEIELTKDVQLALAKMILGGPVAQNHFAAIIKEVEP